MRCPDCGSSRRITITHGPIVDVYRFMIIDCGVCRLRWVRPMFTRLVIADPAYIVSFFLTYIGERDIMSRN